MKKTSIKKHILTLTFLFLSILITAQINNYKPCGTNELLEKRLITDPKLKTLFELNQISLQNTLNSSFINSSQTATTQYTIPVVFHIIHNGNYFYADTTIRNILKELNKVFSRTTDDTATIATPFKNLFVNSGITFMLAKKDTSGNCTSGIVYYENSTKFNWDGAAANNPSYWPTWNSSKYLNIVVPTGSVFLPGVGFVGGYANYPGVLNVGDPRDGVVSVLNARTIAHEVGHWLNLPHVFGAATSTITCGDDGISDTPPSFNPYNWTTMTALDCASNQSGNSCNGSGLNNVENIMHYFQCPKNFTQGQTTVMRSALSSTVSARDNVCSLSNLLFTGVNATTTCSPKALFISNKNTICANGSIAFSDYSYNGTTTTWQWILSGGTPSISSVPNPTITYNVPGTYSVKLKVSNSMGIDSLIKVAFIKVNPPASIKNNLSESFENVGTIPSADWLNYNTSGNTWQLSSTAAATGTNCLRLYNIPQNCCIGRLTSTFRVKLDSNYITFKHAYAQTSAASDDILFVYVSPDCGETWVNIKGISGSTLSTTGGAFYTNTFVPTPNQWATDTVYKPSFITESEVMIRFEFWLQTTKGSDIFLDDINIHQKNYTNIDEQFSNNRLVLFPNPTQNTISVVSEGSVIKELYIMNSFGQIICKKDNIHSQKETMSLSDLASGLYIIQIQTTVGTFIKKVVKD